MSVADFQKSPDRISSADAEVRWPFPSAQSLLRHSGEQGSVLGSQGKTDMSYPSFTGGSPVKSYKDE